MALARLHIWNPGDLLKSADLNGEFNNILNNPISLISPTTGTIVFTSNQTLPEFVGTAPLVFTSTTAVALNPGVIPLIAGGTTSVQPSQRIIASAITLSATSTSPAFVANTNYYVYAVDSSGTTLLRYGTTGLLPHAAEATYGIEVASTDSRLTLVGMIRTNPSTQFSDSLAERYVNSWFNRKGLVCFSSFNGNATTTVTSFQELSTNVRCNFINWTSQAITVGTQGTASCPAGDAAVTSVNFDTTAGAEPVGIYISVGGSTSITITGSIGFSYGKNLVEGYHFATITGRTLTTGTATWLGDAVGGRMIGLSVVVV